MRVQVRVLRARGAVLVSGGDEARPRARASTPPAPAADDARFVLEVGERGLPGGGMRLVDGPASFLVAERMQQADALGNREDEVVARDRSQRLLLEPPLARRGVDPLDRDPACAAGCRRRSRLPVRGCSPADQRSQLALLDAPSSPSASAPRPVQTPGDSPRPA